MSPTEITPNDELRDYMTEQDVTFTPEQPSLVYLRRKPAQQIIRRHGSNPTWVQEAISAAGGHVLSELVISRRELAMLPVTTESDTRRLFHISTQPLRAYTAEGREQVDLYDEQYNVACTLGDNYADTPELWLGTIEGPARTDAIEDIMDGLEDQLPTILALGQTGIVLTDNFSQRRLSKMTAQFISDPALGQAVIL